MPLAAAAIPAAGAKSPLIASSFVDLLIEAPSDLLRAFDQPGVGGAGRQCRLNAGTNASRRIPVDAIDVIGGDELQIVVNTSQPVLDFFAPLLFLT